jgi:hypothetical protein
MGPGCRRELTIGSGLCLTFLRGECVTRVGIFSGDRLAHLITVTRQVPLGPFILLYGGFSIVSMPGRAGRYYQDTVLEQCLLWL